jgi:cytochrome P450
MNIPLNETTSNRTLEPPTLPAAALDRDPHGTYRSLRPSTPLIRREDGSYIVIRAADVEQLTTDPRTRQVETERLKLHGVTADILFEFFSQSMLYTNGPDHRRRRAPMSRAFAFKLISELRPRIRAVAGAIIDRHLARGEMNFLDDYAALIPAQIVSEILGLPAADLPQFTSRVYSFVRAFGFSYTSDDVPQFEAAARDLYGYAADLLAQRRAVPRADFLTTYAQAIDEQGNLSNAEALAQIVTIIVAGSDTTRAAMAMQVALLLQHREQWDAICRDPKLVPGAVSECLRFEPSVGSFTRFTLADIEIDGYLLPSQRVISLSTMSAMRDPTLYTDPDTFNIKRTDQVRRHPVFGGGAHRCLGEALAWAELEEGLIAVVERLPQLQLAAEPPVLLGHSGIRRITDMRVSWPS